MPRSPAGLRRAAACVLLLTLLASDLEAQVRIVRRGDERLKGITSVDIFVAGFDGPNPCGLDKTAVQREAVRTLNRPGLRATVSQRASSWFYTVRVDVRWSLTGGHCATSTSVSLIAHVDGIPEADRSAAPGEWGSLLVGEMTLLHDLAVVQSEGAGHPALVTAALRKQISAIGERIRLANRQAEP